MCRCTVAVLPFRSYTVAVAVAVAGENGNAGNVFPYVMNSASPNFDTVN